MLLGPAPHQRLSAEKRSRTKIIGAIKQGDDIRKHRKRPLSSCILQSLGKDNGRSEFAAIKKENEEEKKRAKSPERAKWDAMLSNWWVNKMSKFSGFNVYTKQGIVPSYHSSYLA